MTKCGINEFKTLFVFSEKSCPRPQIDNQITSNEYVIETPEEVTYLFSSYQLERGAKRYELANHLGNVLTVVSDKKTAICTGNTFNYLAAERISATDYSPFGAPLAGRTWNGGEYRFGFNTQERDDEIAGVGNIMTAQFWEYDTRLGRRWNVDPKPRFGISNYSAFGNNPIFNVDPNGDYFFGLIGSTKEQRKAAKKFKEQFGGYIENYHSENICVKYSTGITVYDKNECRLEVVSLAKTAHFNIDGSFSPKELKSNYTFEFSIEMSISIGPQIGLEVEGLSRAVGFELNVASVDLLSLKAEMHNFDGNATLSFLGKGGYGKIKQGMGGGIGLASGSLEREVDADLTGAAKHKEDKVKVKGGVGLPPFGASYEAEIPIDEKKQTTSSSSTLAGDVGATAKLGVGVESKLKIGVKKEVK